MAFMDSGCRLRLLVEIVRRFKRALSWGLLIRLPRAFTDRSLQRLRQRLVRFGGHAKEVMTLGSKLPLSCRRSRLGGQSMDWVSSTLREVDAGRRRVLSLVRCWRVFLSWVKGIESPTRKRSRYLRLWHLDSAGKLFELVG